MVLSVRDDHVNQVTCIKSDGIICMIFMNGKHDNLLTCNP